MTAPPVEMWEDELARLAAHRTVARACARLSDGTWDEGALAEALAAAGRRMTVRQAEAIERALRRSDRLRELTARTP